ncbi:hypothetical protein [Stenotrophomonas maltophilia]|uniref:hypothetical protein n=1 Tax=Stenotrophomonas maltophilia TaxID=40324 RepID=UPI000C1502A3|nr:hypothetical protein [Stenotrophomonas maltophilia]
MSNNYEGLADALTDMHLRIARLELATVALLKELTEAKALSPDFSQFLQRNAEEHASKITSQYFQQLPGLMAQWTELVSKLQSDGESK